MEAQPYFKNIRFHLAKELNLAEHRIYAAVAWLTDASLFNILCLKAKEGLDVQLIVVDDEINRNYGPKYDQLVTNGGRLYRVASNFSDNIMHHKFCVIDKDITVTGSYNWSKKAQGNHENIIITKEYEELADSFVEEFKRIKFQYYGADPLKAFDAKVVVNRLTIIKVLLELEEYEGISMQISKLSDYELSKEIVNCFDLIDKKNYNLAASSIRDYLSRMQSLTIYEDLSIPRIKWEIGMLEAEIIALEQEKSSLEKKISDFNYEYQIAFGELIIEILRLKKRRMEAQGRGNTNRYAEAERSFREATEEYESALENKHGILTEQEISDLKAAYKKAVILCHPDKFQDENDKRKAHDIFIKLQDAYKKNNIVEVMYILKNLENGILDFHLSNSLSDKELLKSRLQYLKERRDQILNTILSIIQSKNYRDIVSFRKDVNFFAEEKTRLENELNSLKNEQ